MDLYEQFCPFLLVWVQRMDLYEHFGTFELSHIKCKAGVAGFQAIPYFCEDRFEAYEKVLSGHDGTSESGALVSGRVRFPGRDEFRSHPGV